MNAALKAQSFFSHDWETEHHPWKMTSREARNLIHTYIALDNDQVINRQPIFSPDIESAKADLNLSYFPLARYYEITKLSEKAREKLRMSVMIAIWPTGTYLKHRLPIENWIELVTLAQADTTPLIPTTIVRRQKKLINKHANKIKIRLKDTDPSRIDWIETIPPSELDHDLVSPDLLLENVGILPHIFIDQAATDNYGGLSLAFDTVMLLRAKPLQHVYRKTVSLYRRDIIDIYNRKKHNEILSSSCPPLF